SSVGVLSYRGHRLREGMRSTVACPRAAARVFRGIMGGHSARDQTSFPFVRESVQARMQSHERGSSSGVPPVAQEPVAMSLADSAWAEAVAFTRERSP